MSNQGQIFLNSEGDSWYERNKSAIENANASVDTTFIIQTLKGSQFEIQDLLEVGCSSAVKLNWLAESFSARGSGIDPSSLAIQQGKKQYPDLDLNVGLASRLPFEADKFDLVFFGFCLYLVPPEEIEITINEALRVLRPKGFIALTDFDPGIEMTVPYKHVKGLASYKRDYMQLLNKLSNVTLIAKHSFSISGNFFVEDKNSRVSTQIYFMDKPLSSLSKITNGS
jgi:ubiquinone/menaquinone biosynthesis C-methylase UbiE